MTPQERLDYLLEVAAIPSNRGRLTHSRASAEPSLGHTVADQVYAAIKAVSEPTSIRYAAGEGIDTASATWKAQATHVAESNEALAPHLVTLRDFESIYQPRWQTEGYEAEPTLAQIQAEDDRESTYQAYRDIHSAHIVPVLDGESPTVQNLIAAFRAAADAMEAE